MIQFQYDENGNLIATENREKIGNVVTMGDIIEDIPMEEVNEDSSKDHIIQNNSSRICHE